MVQLGLASGGPAEQSAVLERLYSAHFTEGRAIDDVATLQRLAAEAGLDERRVAAVLAADDYAEQVREDEAMATRLGIHAVPHLVAGTPPGAVALSGAQPLDTVLDALRTAWERLESG
jgi:predicted DsbA family dithiol-disulfide isomerase